MIYRHEFEKYKTDEERLSVLHRVSFIDWGYVAEWEQEAKTPEAKRAFHSVAVRLYHQEEASAGLL